MEKDKKYNVILGLMIFFFIIIVAGCLAWGLGIIGIKESKAEGVQGSITPVPSKQEEPEIANTNNTNVKETATTTEKALSQSEIEKINKEYIIKYFSIRAAGDGVSVYKAVMGYSDEEVKTHNAGNTVEIDVATYNVTDVEYALYKEKISFMESNFAQNLLAMKGMFNVIEEYNGKVAYVEGGWTGGSYEFVSQALTKNDGNNYEWKVIMRSQEYPGSDGFKEQEYKVTGKLEDGKYILMNVQEASRAI